MLNIRRATQADYADVVRWMVELAVDDAPPTLERWRSQYMAGTIIAELAEPLSSRARRPVGYAFYQLNDEDVYVRNVVTGPAFRRRGVGRALMKSMAERARDEGATTWRLNVRPDNAPAVGLYEAFGMRKAHSSAALRLDFEVCARLRAARTVQRVMSEVEWAALEAQQRLASGMIARRAEHGDLVLATFAPDHAHAPRSCAVFDPVFPGAFIFKPADQEDAEALLRSMLANCPTTSGPGFLQVVVENNEALIAHLLERGARVQMRFAHYQGAL